MQFYNFIFLDRSWASDRLNLAAKLSALGKQAEAQDSPLSLIIYPEGTLVSENTRPISKKYAEKMGIVGSSHFHSTSSIFINVPLLKDRLDTSLTPSLNRFALLSPFTCPSRTQLTTH